MQIVTVNESNCVGCNACVRVCPVHANVTRLKDGTRDEFVTTIDATACINCGECVKACMHQARDYNDNIDTFIEMFESKKKMVLIVAPSVRTSFPNGAWRVLLSWLREHGNCKIYDVGFGADICTYMHNEYMKRSGDSKKIVTQPCPAVVNYIQKYKPELIPNLSPVMSPAGCLAVWLKKYRGVKDPMFMLSPCIAKTSEAVREKAFDYNVTFRHLEKYVLKNGLHWERKAQFEFDELEGGIGRLYPMPGGLKETLQILNQDLIIRNAEGPHTLYDRLERYAHTEDRKKPDVLDVLNCEFGCNQGTAVPETVANLMEVENIMDDISLSNTHETQGGFLGIGRLKRFKEFDKTLSLSDFMTDYHSERVRQAIPTANDYLEIFHSMHKMDAASQAINCGSCGYNTCKDMAHAIFLGMNVKENCIHYLKHSLKQSYRQLRDVYGACVAEVQEIGVVSQQVQESQSEILDASSDINQKASKLSGNIARLQKLSQTYLEQYQGKQAETLTTDDFVKMQKFIAAIGTMTKSYYDVAKEFEETSGNIQLQIQSMNESVTNLSGISDGLQNVMLESAQNV